MRWYSPWGLPYWPGWMGPWSAWKNMEQRPNSMAPDNLPIWPPAFASYYLWASLGVRWLFQKGIPRVLNESILKWISSRTKEVHMMPKSNTVANQDGESLIFRPIHARAQPRSIKPQGIDESQGRVALSPRYSSNAWNISSGKTIANQLVRPMHLFHNQKSYIRHLSVTLDWY